MSKTMNSYEALSTLSILRINLHVFKKVFFFILERRLSDFLLTFEFENKVFYDSQTGDFQFSKSDKIFKPIDNSAIEWIKKYRLPLFLKTHTIYQYNQVSYLLVLKLFDR